MKKLLSFLLILCLVVVMTAPVSAYYYEYKDISADDLTIALIDCADTTRVHNMTDYNCEIGCGYFVQDIMFYNVVRTDKTLDFEFDGKGWYGLILPIPPLVLPLPYSFSGYMHVYNPLIRPDSPYTLVVNDDDDKFIAVGYNWKLQVWNTEGTRFYRGETPPLFWCEADCVPCEG